MSFEDHPPTSKPEPTKFLKRGEGPKTQKFYGKYAMYPANEQQLYGVDPNLPALNPDINEIYMKDNKPFQYSISNKTKGGRRRRMKQTKRKRRKQTKRLR